MHCAKRLALLSGAIEAIAATATPIGFPHVPDRVLADHSNSFLSRRARQLRAFLMFKTALNYYSHTIEQL